jgi:hypothetical protein
MKICQQRAPWRGRVLTHHHLTTTPRPLREYAKDTCLQLPVLAELMRGALRVAARASRTPRFF